MLNYFHGREARAASRRWNVFKTLLQMVIFWSTFLFVIPAGIYATEQAVGLECWRFDSTVSQWCGGVLFALGGSLGVTSGMVMAARGRGTPLPTDCARELVISGPYRYIRNPMAVAGLSQGIAVGIFLGSPAIIIYAFLGGPIWHVFVRPWEELDLEQRFGEPYRNYRAAVKCWLPRFSGYHQSRESLAG